MQPQRSVHQNSARMTEINLLRSAKKKLFHILWGSTEILLGCTAEIYTTAPAVDVVPSIITTPSAVSWDLYCLVMHLDISQQPVRWWDARLGEVVPPPWLLLALYISIGCMWIVVALELIVGVKSIPRVHRGEEVVVDVGLHRDLGEGEEHQWEEEILSRYTVDIQTASLNPLDLSQVSIWEGGHKSICESSLGKEKKTWKWLDNFLSIIRPS